MNKWILRGTAKLHWIILITVTGCAAGNCDWPKALTDHVPVYSTAASFRFAVIGDFGTDLPDELAVAGLVKSWNPHFIITTGDNNYPDGEASTIDANIGKYYSEYIHPYTGQYRAGAGKELNRFFPTLGNHDWKTECARPYTDYFNLPGNERYYSFVWGPVQFFALDSEKQERDGRTAASRQAKWLKTKLANSKAGFKIVYFHSPPYTSGRKGPAKVMRWPFKEWGADAVLSGDSHIYERLIVDDLAYFVNGLGGAFIQRIDKPVEGSRVRYNEAHGAMLVIVSETSMVFEFYNRQGELIDRYVLVKGE